MGTGGIRGVVGFLEVGRGSMGWRWAEGLRNGLEQQGWGLRDSGLGEADQMMERLGGQVWEPE